MKRALFAAAIAAISAPAFAADVGVSISVGQPGFYGQINLGSVPQPQLVYEQPVIIQQAPEYRGGPIYLHVPPGHEKHWEKHCAQYNACGRPVYFVRDDWYNNEYVPRYRHDDEGRGREDDEEHGHGHGHGNGHGHDKGDD